MSSKRFIISKSQLERRWDPQYFQPLLVALDDKVQGKTKLRLRDFVRSMAGGATPLKSEADQHYADENTGIPFIRVQNLTTTGQLDIKDVKYITQDTNDGLLARSRLKGGELLVKITGVGRMAVASVVPENFSANINQHIVAIQTESFQQSQALAAYLNLDFVERLASRRSTGGTRPALDYQALLSIPVIENPLILEIMDRAHRKSLLLENEVVKLLSEVRNVVHAALAIPCINSHTLPVKDRIFAVRATQLTGNIFDPKTHAPRSVELFKSLELSQFPSQQLRAVVTHRMAGDWGDDEDLQDDLQEYERCLVIRGTEFDNELNLRIENGREKYRSIKREKLGRMRIEAGDLLIEKSGGSPDQPVGRVTILNEDLLNSQTICYSNFVEKIKPDQTKVLPAYLFHYLRFIHAIGVTDLLQSQTNGIRNLMIHRYLNLPVSLPTLEVQAVIVAQIQALQNEAISLRTQAALTLSSAKQEVEKLILGK